MFHRAGSDLATGSDHADAAQYTMIANGQERLDQR
jgi:hypothetical protein